MIVPAVTLVMTSTVAVEPKVTLSPVENALEILVAPRLTQLVVVVSQLLLTPPVQRRFRLILVIER